MGDENFESQVIKLYKEILLREPDKTGLYFFTSQLKSQKMNVEDVKNSLLNSEEGKTIQNFSHYSDKYWNELSAVIQYKNKLSTDNESLTWLDDLKNRFSNVIPFKKVLIVGCGNGWVERQLFDSKIGLDFDAFDISQKYIDEAAQLSGDRPIKYFIDNVNTMEKISEEKYDAIFNFAVLHHTENLDYAMKKLSKALKPDGLMFNEEYVGPARNQYSEEQLFYMFEVMSELPEKFRNKHPLRPALENFRIEPTEAIHSDLVIPAFKKYFETVFERNMNGGIAYQILWNNIEHFKNYDNPEVKKWLEFILTKDDELTKQGKVPVLFWYGVGKSKMT